MGISALGKLLPLEDGTANATFKNVPITSDSLLEHYRSDLEADKSLDIAEAMSHFHSYNKELSQHRKKLEPVGAILEGFPKDLKDLSSSLVSLEQQSTELSKDSHTNKMITQMLERTINEKVLPPELIRDILHEELSNKYFEKVNYLLDKMNEEDSQLIKAKVVERTRDFVISQIRALRTKPISSQEVQNKLFACSDLFHFLQSQQPKLGQQLQQAYQSTMRWYYRSKFAKYVYSLEKLSRRHLEDTIFDSPNYLSTFESRYQILSSADSCMPSQLAETITVSYTIEFVFLQLLRAIADNLTVEYLFVVSFFYAGNETNHTWALDMFRDVFKMSTDFLAVITNGTGDVYGILLIIRLIHNFQEKLHENHIPALDDHLNSLLLTLWPIFSKLIDLNCDALKREIPRTPKSLVPLNVTQQFALFYSGLLRLSSKGEPSVTAITRLRNAYESNLTKAANAFKGHDKETFLDRNYSLVYTIVSNEAEDSTSEINHFEKLASVYKS
ncbi:VPS52 [Candida margitis]|uniref:VPS52 n=1 Tax=Candida margitis TaxID=1775924 RepID=UPI0022261A42|nr:VPS52 [Candida margitis]KAI5963925.1 VPS52 [Candida margitis]